MALCHSTGVLHRNWSVHSLQVLTEISFGAYRVEVHQELSKGSLDKRSARAEYSHVDNLGSWEKDRTY